MRRMLYGLWTFLFKWQEISPTDLNKKVLSFLMPRNSPRVCLCHVWNQSLRQCHNDPGSLQLLALMVFFSVGFLFTEKSTYIVKSIPLPSLGTGGCQQLHTYILRLQVQRWRVSILFSCLMTSLEFIRISFIWSLSTSLSQFFEPTRGNVLSGEVWVICPPLES